MSSRQKARHNTRKANYFRYHHRERVPDASRVLSAWETARKERTEYSPWVFRIFREALFSPDVHSDLEVCLAGFVSVCSVRLEQPKVTTFTITEYRRILDRIQNEQIVRGVISSIAQNMLNRSIEDVRLNDVFFEESLDPLKPNVKYVGFTFDTNSASLICNDIKRIFNQGFGMRQPDIGRVPHLTIARTTDGASAERISHILLNGGFIGETIRLLEPQPKLVRP